MSCYHDVLGCPPIVPRAIRVRVNYHEGSSTHTHAHIYVYTYIRNLLEYRRTRLGVKVRTSCKNCDAFALP